MTPFDMERWLSEKTARARAIHCPECGSLEPLPLVLGLPGAELEEASERAEVALGGCVVPPGPRPAWRCRGCGLEFPDPVDAKDRQ